MILLGEGKAYFFSIISFIGIIFLLVLGYLFDTKNPGFTEGTKDPENPEEIAHACYLAAGAYFVLFVFSVCQATLHARKSRNAVRL